MTRTAAAIATALLAAHASAQQRFELGNGATVIVIPVEGVGHVGVESFYQVGFVDEPAGLTQAAHLAEHLMCMGALGGLEQGEAWSTLNDLGMANAETLATLTHYDATATPDGLETILSIEAARLRGVAIDREIVAREAGRCGAEALNLQRLPRAPMYKFALMAAHQAWAHDRTDANVTSGLDEIDLDALGAFVSSHYTPANLTFLVVGDVDAAEVRTLAERTIGDVPGAIDDAGDTEIDWSAQPRDRTVAWDSTASAIIVGVGPPSDATARLVQSLWGALLAQRLQTDMTIADVTTYAVAGSHIAPVGPLPFHAYATLGAGADADEAAERLGAALARHAAEATPADAAQIRALGTALRTTPTQTRPAIDAQVRRLAASGYDRDRAVGLILANAALQAGIGAHLADLYAADAFGELATLDDQAILDIIRTTADPDRRFVTRLAPREP